MNANNDRCAKLHQLYDRLIHEIQQLQAAVDQEEQEGVGNPIETVNIIKGLQSALQSIELELEKCP
jgi:flagellin-specific chaperone FliS